MFKSKDAKSAAPAGAPATPPAPQVDHELEGLMSEIESDLREDQFRKIWNRFGTLIIASGVVLILGVAGYQLWRGYETRERDVLANRYDAAVTQFDAGKYDVAAKEFADIANKKGEGYAALARLQEAASKLQQGDKAGAIAAYKALGEDKSIDPVLRDLGTILRVMHALDTEDPKTLEAALGPLLAPGTTYYHSALELGALLAAKQGDKTRAVQLAEQITNDPAAPAGVRERAQDLATLYKPASPATASLPPAAAPVAVTPAAATPAAAAPSPASPPQGK